VVTNRQLGSGSTPTVEPVAEAEWVEERMGLDPEPGSVEDVAVAPEIVAAVTTESVVANPVPEGIMEIAHDAMTLRPYHRRKRQPAQSVSTPPTP
jgi:hypothetical protein